MPPKRKTPFNVDHIIRFGLKICERDPSTKRVVSVSCRFCVHFGREQKVGAKRKATTNIHYFRSPFCIDVYLRHLKSQHALHWEKYSAFSSEQTATTFFDDNAPVVHCNTIRSHFGGVQTHIHHFVNKCIVDVIVSEMFFHPDDGNDEITKERALAIFEDIVGPEESAVDSDLQTDRYRIFIKNPIQFRLVIGFVGGGASFRMASRFLLLTKEQMGLASLGSASEGKVTGLVRFVCALNLQKISEIMASS